MKKEMLLDDIKCAIRKQLKEEGRTYEVACLVAEHVAETASKKTIEEIKELRNYLIAC